jgi:hypothetical protein
MSEERGIFSGILAPYWARQQREAEQKRLEDVFERMSLDQLNAVIVPDNENTRH